MYYFVLLKKKKKKKKRFSIKRSHYFPDSEELNHQRELQRFSAKCGVKTPNLGQMPKWAIFLTVIYYRWKETLSATSFFKCNIVKNKEK